MLAISTFIYDVINPLITDFFAIRVETQKVKSYFI